MICFVMFFINDCKVVLCMWFVIYVIDEVERCCFKVVIFDVEIFWFMVIVIRWMLFLRLWSLDKIFVKLVLVKVWKWLVSLLLIVNFNIVILLVNFCILLEVFFLFISNFSFFVKLRNINDWLVIVDWSLFNFFVFFCRIFLIWIIFCIRKIKEFWW